MSINQRKDNSSTICIPVQPSPDEGEMADSTKSYQLLNILRHDC